MVDVYGASCSIIDERRDIENLIRLEQEPIRTKIRFFDKSDDCLTFIQENAESTAIFLITSSYFGRSIAPVVADQISAIYVLCIKIENDMVWAPDYAEFIQMFDFDTDLLIRLIRDIAEYCMERGIGRMENDDKKQALKHLSDAKILLHRANMIDKRYFDNNLYYIDNLLNMLSNNQKTSLECEDA